MLSTPNTTPHHTPAGLKGNMLPPEKVCPKAWEDNVASEAVSCAPFSGLQAGGVEVHVPTMQRISGSVAVVQHAVGRAGRSRQAQEEVLLCGGICACRPDTLAGVQGFAAPLPHRAEQKGRSLAPQGTLSRDEPWVQRYLHASCAVAEGVLLSGGVGSAAGNPQPLGDVCLVAAEAGGAMTAFATPLAQRMAHTMCSRPGCSAAVLFGGWEWRAVRGVVRQRLSNTVATVSLLRGVEGRCTLEVAKAVPRCACACTSRTAEPTHRTPVSEPHATPEEDLEKVSNKTVPPESDAHSLEIVEADVQVAAPEEGREAEAAVKMCECSCHRPGPAVAPQVPAPRAYHTAVLTYDEGRKGRELCDSSLVVMGGVGHRVETSQRKRMCLLSDVWVYSCGEGRWSCVEVPGFAAAVGQGIAGHSAVFHPRSQAVLVCGGVRGELASAQRCLAVHVSGPTPVCREVHIPNRVGHVFAASRIYHSAVLVEAGEVHQHHHTSGTSEHGKRCYAKVLRQRDVAVHSSSADVRVMLFGGVHTSGLSRVGSQCTYTPEALGVFDKPLRRRIDIAAVTTPANTYCDLALAAAAPVVYSSLGRRLYEAQIASLVTLDSMATRAAEEDFRAVHSMHPQVGGYVSQTAPCLAFRLLQHTFLASVRALMRAGVVCYSHSQGKAHRKRTHLWRAQYCLSKDGTSEVGKTSGQDIAQHIEAACGMEPPVFVRRYGKAMCSELCAFLSHLDALTLFVETADADVNDFHPPLIGFLRAMRVCKAAGGSDVLRTAVAHLRGARGRWCAGSDEVTSATPTSCHSVSSASGGNDTDSTNDINDDTNTAVQATLRYSALRSVLASSIDDAASERLYYSGVTKRSEVLRKTIRRALQAEPCPRRVSVKRGALQGTVHRLHMKGCAAVRAHRAQARPAPIVARKSLSGPDQQACEDAFVRRFYYLPVEARHKYRNLLQLCHTSYVEGLASGTVPLRTARTMLSCTRKALAISMGTMLYCPTNYPIAPCCTYKPPPVGCFRSLRHQKAEMLRMTQGRKVPDGEVLMGALQAIVEHVAHEMKKAKRTLTESAFREYTSVKLDPFTTFEITCTLEKLGKTAEMDDLEPHLDFFWHQGSFLPSHPTVRDVGVMASRCSKSLHGTIVSRDAEAVPLPPPVLVFPAPGFTTLPSRNVVAEAVWMFAHGSVEVQRRLRQFKTECPAISW